MPLRQEVDLCPGQTARAGQVGMSGGGGADGISLWVMAQGSVV